MSNSSGGAASGAAAEPARGSSSSSSATHGGFRVTEPAQQCLLLGFNLQLECDSVHGVPLPELGSLDLESKPALSRVFSRIHQAYFLVQAAKEALDGRSSNLELRTESGVWETRITPRLAVGGSAPNGVLVHLRDARVRTREWESLTRTSDLYRLAAESGRVGVWEWSPHRGELTFDPILLDILGFPADYHFTPEEACKALLTPEDNEYVRNAVSSLMEDSSATLDIDIRVRGKQGDVRILRVKGDVQRDAKQQAEGIVGVALDVTALRDVEQRSRRNEARLRDLFENATDMMYSTDIEGNFRTVNKAFQAVTGYSRDDLLTMNLRDMVFPEQREGIDRILVSRLGGDNRSIDEITIRHRDGRRIYLETSNRLAFEDGKPSSIQGIGRNVTERKLLEAQLRQAQKMEAVGTLAGGIAHEFNNQLTGILGFADLLKMRPDDPAKTVEAAEIIQKAAERATGLTSQLIGFARQGKTQNSRVRIGELIGELSSFLRHALPRSIRIEQDAVDRSFCVQGDQNQLHQALLNLALNARDAMPSGGKIAFRTERVPRSSIEGVDLLANPGDHWVRISVSDTGEGIEPEHLPRIFEPFFTTKPVGKGSGMGLAMVYRIVRNHGGMVHAESGVDGGATFQILLPLMADEQATPTAPEKDKLHQGSGLVLLVDDEPIVLAVAEMLLSQLGYQVISANSGERAIEIYRSMHNEIALVFLDVMMPGIGGRECARRLRTEFPGVRILMTSGYQPELSEESEAQPDGLVLLHKPYQLPELSQAIERVLAEGPVGQ